MRPETREKREAEILAAAWLVIECDGPDALSMQAVARAAKASMETLYRWYGDKTGLYAALVADNAVRIETALLEALYDASDPAEALTDIGARLFDMVTSDRAVALNRAAAGDASGVLGQALAQGGRERIVPHLAAVLHQLTPTPDTAALFIDLLLGDIQIRRATGSAPLPPPGTGRARSEQAVARLQRLFPAP